MTFHHFPFFVLFMSKVPGHSLEKRGALNFEDGHWLDGKGIIKLNGKQTEALKKVEPGSNGK